MLYIYIRRTNIPRTWSFCSPISRYILATFLNSIYFSTGSRQTSRTLSNPPDLTTRSLGLFGWVLRLSTFKNTYTGWWCNNHLEKWWSSSMGRMTSHIWNGKEQMFETTNQYMSYINQKPIFLPPIGKNTTWYKTCLSGRCHLTCVSQVTPYVPFSSRFTHTKTLRNRSLPVAGPITTLAAHHGSCSPMAGKSEILNVVHPGLPSLAGLARGESHIWKVPSLPAGNKYLKIRILSYRRVLSP